MQDLNVLVVGAGIGGLQASLALAKDGHKITLLESAKAFEKVGAGIRIPPNSHKLSTSWDVDFSRIPKVHSAGNRFVDWHGKTLLSIPFTDIEESYGAPYYFLHRADLISLLTSTALANPRITVRNSCRVEGYDFASPSVTLATGEVLTADLVVSAEGIKSSIRDAINGCPVPPQDTGDVAYRILVPAAAIRADATLAHLIDEPWAMHWMGPEGHAVGYPLREGEVYNIIIDVTHASDRGEALPDDEQVWKSARSNRELVERFHDWCPEVRKLCAMAGEYLKWRLADFDQLARWSAEGGRVVMLGDAVHPMMPYLAQGAAQATEDAAALAAALRTYDDMRSALQAYEAARKPRATYIARNTRVLQEWLHLYDGPARDERDRMMTHDNASNPIFWGCKERKDWLFGFDARDLQPSQAIPALPPMPPDEARVYLDKKQAWEK